MYWIFQALGFQTVGLKIGMVVPKGSIMLNAYIRDMTPFG
jgi:hypothetical protein